jgi:signal transduction histidine kinase
MTESPVRDGSGALAEQLRALAVELGQVEQRERRGLAKILHDHIQQLLAAARIRIELFKSETGGQTIGRTSIQEIDSLLLEAMEAS